MVINRYSLLQALLRQSLFVNKNNGYILKSGGRILYMITYIADTYKSTYRYLENFWRLPKAVSYIRSM